MSRKGLYTIAPHAPFLPLLVERVLDGTLLGGWPCTGPFWLSDVTIILPTRRSRLVLAELFAQRLGRAALLPDIRTFGGEASEEEPFLPPFDAPPLSPAVAPLERRLVLSRLIDGFARSAGGFASPPNAAEVLWLADSLGELIDDLIIEDVPVAALRQLVPAELAENWQQILTFLEIALTAWPEIVAAGGKVDGAASRNERLRRQAATAPLIYGERPVIAAGSTGSIPATAALLSAIADLPRGALVLPGLDTSLSVEQHSVLLDGENTEGHPQFGLAKLLNRLGAGIADVEELGGDALRTTIVRTALALADDTTDWVTRRAAMAETIPQALIGISVLAAPNVDLEARSVALAARDALVKGRTVGIVSRDQTLARRIAAELGRHDVAVDDPAGTPLYQSAAGRLVRLALSAASSGFAPVDIIGLLRNRAVTLGLVRAEVGALTDRLDLTLRGERPTPGLAGIRAMAPSETHDLLDRLGRAMAPLCNLLTVETIDPGTFATALRSSMEELIGAADMPGLLEFRSWAEELARLDTGAAFPPHNLDAVLAALMAGAKAQSGERRRDDIHIWGELEARLQSPDLMILAGVNEDIWPPTADPGPWLSRGMRIGIGLEPPERRQGLAAHDFEMALGNAEVLIAYAERVGSGPALPSRFVQRLDAFIGENESKVLRTRGARWLGEARAIDATRAPRPAQRPLPRPPAHLRPRKLSVTEIETLVRSPYDLYAKHVLRLRRIEPLGQLPEARERGTMIHEVFARFVEHHDVDAPDAARQLQALAEQAFAGLDALAERREIWLRRFARTAEQFLEFERGRNADVERRFAERKGEWHLPLLGFVLTGRADRLDLLTDGTLEILDFKTGAVPTSKQMREYDAPQLLLEAAMAGAGAFAGPPARPASALTYIKVGLGPDAFVTGSFRLRDGMTLSEMVDEASRRMQSHVEALLLGDKLAMAARIRPDVNRRYASDYDHLARTDEWTLTAGTSE